MISAPAGCGKTEALALRVQGLLESNRVTYPRRILVVTFSNRARDNIKERLEARLSRAFLANNVTVSNFHGLSARIFRAHAKVIGMDPELIQPSSDWVSEELTRRRATWDQRDEVVATLQRVKAQPLTDEKILETLECQTAALALEIEQTRQDLGILTYDDLPRLCELILGNKKVAAVYFNHFGAVVVDEFQDLTPQQLRIVQYIGSGKTTFAGDLAQGIYSFAGARPLIVAEEIRGASSDHYSLNESHRSAPAVIDAVNSLNPLTGGQDLVCANPGSWPSGGLFSSVLYPDVRSEANSIARLASSILRNLPNHRVAIIARTKNRRREVEDRLLELEIQAFRWEDGVQDGQTAQRIRKMLQRVNVSDYESALDPIEYLRELVSFDTLPNPDVRVPLADALIWCAELLDQGQAPEAIAKRIRVGDSTTLVNSPGVHLLTGHVGKGQQFDWVFIIGLEEGTLPFFKAVSDDELIEEARVLSVMISRARHGVLLSSVSKIQSRTKQASRFFDFLLRVKPLDFDQTLSWFRGVDFESLSKR